MPLRTVFANPVTYVVGYIHTYVVTNISRIYYYPLKLCVETDTCTLAEAQFVSCTKTAQGASLNNTYSELVTSYKHTHTKVTKTNYIQTIAREVCSTKYSIYSKQITIGIDHRRKLLVLLDWGN